MGMADSVAAFCLASAAFEAGDLNAGALWCKTQFIGLFNPRLNRAILKVLQGLLIVHVSDCCNYLLTLLSPKMNMPRK